MSENTHMELENLIALFIRIAIPYLMGKLFDLIVKQIQSKQQPLHVETTTTVKQRMAQRE